ncbi:MAG: hypothetical protein K6G90_02945 [Clostridia bacterium]|nr:hypothetical protein [Clostridia bacterium]
MTVRDAAISVLDRDYNCTELDRKSKSVLLYPESKRAFLHNPFLPIILVSVHENKNGTTLSIETRLRSRVRNFLIAFIVIELLAETALLTRCAVLHSFSWLYVCVPPAVSVVAYLVLLTGLTILSKSVFRQFEDEFNDS